MASASSGANVQLQLQRVQKSALYANVAAHMVPVIYSSMYNVSFWGLEKLHPFDASKWGKVCNLLVASGALDQARVVEPPEATKEDLLVVHTSEYLESLKQGFVVASITEILPVAFLPHCIVRYKLLHPFRKQVGGTVLAGKLAMERGWAINIGGGFHHCCGNAGGGFCVYADISICIEFAFAKFHLKRIMIIDLDAHQGNGHERDYANDDRVYIFDMYNREIYPQDYEARGFIDRRIEITSGTGTAAYISLLRQELQEAFQEFEAELVIYNAGTDILDGDPLGRLKVSPAGVEERDEIVFQFCRERQIPIVMLTSGGYMKTSAGVIAASILKLNSRGLIKLS